MSNNDQNNTSSFTADYSAFAGYTAPIAIDPTNYSSSFALVNTTTQEDDPAMYFPQYHLQYNAVQQYPAYYQPCQFAGYDAQVLQQQQQQQDTELDFMSDYFANGPQSPLNEEAKNERQPQRQPQQQQPVHNVALSQNMLEQIMTATEDNNANIVEMLRSKIKAAMHPQTEDVAAVCESISVVDTRPIATTIVPLHTEHIHHEKQNDKKKGIVKKRRYVKSGLYRKDKNGNFIFSSSDRAKMSQNQDEQQEGITDNTQGTRVKRPLNAYNIFCKMHFDQVKRENPEMSINELSKLMGEKWKGMSKSEKKVYYDKVEHGQTRYKKPLNSYNLFCKKNFDALKKEFPNRSIHVLSKIIAERWKKLSESEKKIYYDEAEKQKQSEELNQQEQYQQQQQQQQQQFVEQEQYSQQQYQQLIKQQQQLLEQQQYQQQQQIEQQQQQQQYNQQQQFFLKEEYQVTPQTTFQPLAFDGADFDLFLS